MVETLIALTTVVGIALSARDRRARSSASTSTRPSPRLGGASSARPSGSSWAWRRSASSLGLRSAGEISQLLFGTTDDAKLVAASFVGLWAGMNWTQLTIALPRRGALRRVRVGERREHPRHRRGDAAPRRRPRQGPDRRDRRQLHGHARRVRDPRRSTAASSSGSSSTGNLLREMNRFGSRSCRPRSSCG